MTYYKQEWLPHLKDAIPPEAKRNQISLYTIALEGWRRGLDLKFYRHTDHQQNKNIRYALSNDSKIHYFTGSSGDFNTQQAFDICEDKALTAEYLEKSNVPIPKGATFTTDTQIEEILTYTKELGYPIVVKPTDGSGGAGVFANITNENELIEAIEFIRKKQQFKEIIVQQYVTGEEIRVYVLENTVLAAANRLPANVIGDGEQTIVQLIREKNELRKSTPHLYHRPIKIDAQVKQLIEQEKYTLESVLPKGKRLYLRKTSNVSTGGDPVDVTNQLTQDQRNIAINASNAIPGLTHSGVDIIIHPKTSNAVVLEVNTRPGIGSHLFPVEGQGIDIPKAIIDLYFPETKNRKEYFAKEYIDLRTAFDSLNSELLSEIETVPPPTCELKAKKYLLTSKMEPIDFYAHIKRYLLTHKIQGYIKTSSGGTELEVVAAHEESKELSNFLNFLEQRKSLLQIKQIQEQPYHDPIKMGFSIIDGLYSMSALELEVEYNQLDKERKTIEKELNRLTHRVNLMKNSNAWKLTAPIRMLTSLLKRK